MAYGGGEERTVDLQVEVTAPTFELVPSITHTVLNTDGTVTFTVTANHLYGHTSDVWLEMIDSPSPRTDVDEQLILTGTSVATISDMEIVQGGLYSYTLWGQDGVNVVSTTLTMEVTKPYYDLTTQTEITVTAQTTSMLRLPVEVSFNYGWDKPVTLMIDPSSAPRNGQFGFTPKEARQTDPVTDEFGFLMLDDYVILDQAGQAELLLEVTDRTPVGTYILPLQAESNGKQRTVELWLNVSSSLTALENPQYLPIIISTHKSVSPTYLPVILKTEK
jgi:hypothetical protein